MINFQQYYQIIVEGGNIFTKDPTTRIQLADIGPTVEMLSRIVGFDLSKNLLGSTGKRESSGDLDIAIDSNKITKDELTARLLADLYKTYAEKGSEEAKLKVDPKDYIKRTGISVHYKTPIFGKYMTEFVQTDFMFVPNIKFAKFAIANDENSPYNGKHRQIILANLAKNINCKWSGLNGIVDRVTNATVESTNPDRVAQILLGDSGAKERNLKSIPDILNFLLKKYGDVSLVLSMLNESRQTILKDGIDIATLLPQQKITESVSRIKPSGGMESTGKRIGIQHLYSEYNPANNSMGFENFEDFINVLDDNGGIIQPGNSTVTEKIDGMGCRFGITADNKFFLQTSNSDTLVTDGDFKSKESKSVGSKIAREAFETNFKKIKSVVYKTLLHYKQQLKLKGGLKVQAEWLYSPFATPREDNPGLVYWVATNYETDKIGKWSTFALINITDLQHNELPEDIKNDISLSLVNLTTKDVKILPVNIDVFRPIDLTEEMRMAEQQISIFYSQYPNYQDILYNTSRKHADTKPKKEMRQHLQSVFLPIQKRMHEKILREVNRLTGRLGEFEGIVIQLKDSEGSPLTFKVISPSFHRNKGRI